MAGMLRARDSRYVMVVDDVDLISRRLVATMGRTRRSRRQGLLGRRCPSTGPSTVGQAGSHSKLPSALTVKHLRWMTTGLRREFFGQV